MRAVPFSPFLMSTTIVSAKQLSIAACRPALSSSQLLRLIKGYDDHETGLWENILCQLEFIFGHGELSSAAVAGRKLKEHQKKPEGKSPHEAFSDEEGDTEMLNKSLQSRQHGDSHDVDHDVRWSLLLACRQARDTDWEAFASGPAYFIDKLLSALPKKTVTRREVESWKELLLRNSKQGGTAPKLTTDHYRSGQSLLYVLLGGEGHVHDHDRDLFIRCCEKLRHVSHVYAHKNNVPLAMESATDEEGDGEEGDSAMSSDDDNAAPGTSAATKFHHRTQLEADRAQFMLVHPALCTPHNWHRLQIADKKMLVAETLSKEAKELLHRIYTFHSEGGSSSTDATPEVGHLKLWNEVALCLVRRGRKGAIDEQMSHRCREIVALLNSHDTHEDTCKKILDHLNALVGPNKSSATMGEIHDLMMQDTSFAASIRRKVQRFADAFDPVSVLVPVWGTRSFAQHVPSAISMKHPRTICILLSFLLCAAIVFTSVLALVVVGVPQFDLPVLLPQTTLAISNCHVVLYSPCSAPPPYATFSKRNVVSQVVSGTSASIKLSSFGVGCRLAMCSDLPSAAVNITTDTSTIILSGLQNWNVNVSSSVSTDASRVIVSETSRVDVAINAGVVIVENMKPADFLNVNNNFGPVMVFGQTQPSGKMQYPAIQYTPAMPSCQERSYVKHQQLAPTSGTVNIVNATSLYVMDPNSTESSLVRSAAMNAQNVTLSPATISWLNSTSTWISAFPNQDFVQVVDVVAPTVGYTLLNSNRQLLVELSPVLISAVTLFALSSSYRKTATVLNHYGCRPVGDVFRIGTNIRPTEELSADQIHQLYFYEESSKDLFQATSRIQAVVQGQGFDTSITTIVPANTTDRYVASQNKFGEFVTTPLVWRPLTTAVIAISLAAAFVLVAAVCGAGLIFRKEIVMSLLEYENRRRNRSLCLHPPGLCDYYWSFSFSYLVGWITVPLMKNLFKRSAKDIVEWYCYTFLSREKGSNQRQQSYMTLDAVIRQIHMYASFTLSGISSVSDPDTVVSLLEHVRVDGAKLSITKKRLEVVEGVTHCPNPKLATESLFGVEYTKSSSSADCVALSELMSQTNMTRDDISSFANIVTRDVYVILGVTSSFDTRSDKKPYTPDAPDAEDSSIDHVVETLEASCSIFPVFAQMRFEHTARGHYVLTQLLSGGLIITQAVMYTLMVMAPIAAIVIYITLLHVEETKYYAYSVQSRLELAHFVEEMYYYAAGVTLKGDPYEALAAAYLAVGCFVIAQPIFFPLFVHVAKSIFHGLTRCCHSSSENHSSSSALQTVKVLLSFFFEVLRFFVLFFPGFATFVFVVYWIFVVLEWWVLGAIIAPKVMLPFATAAVTVVGGIVGAGSSLKQMRKDVVDRLEQRLIEKMVKMLSEPMHLNPQQAQQMTQIAVAIEACNLDDLVAFTKNPKAGMDQSLAELIEPIAQAIGVPSDVTILALCIAMKHTGPDFADAMNKLFLEWNVPTGIAQLATAAVAQMLASKKVNDGAVDTFFNSFSSKEGNTEAEGEEDAKEETKKKGNQLVQSFGSELGSIAKRVMRLTKCDGKTMGNEELHDTIIDTICILMRSFHQSEEGCEVVTQRMQKLARSFLRGTSSRVDTNDLLTSLKELLSPLGSSMFDKDYVSYFSAYEELVQLTLTSLAPAAKNVAPPNSLHDKIIRACVCGVHFLNNESAAAPTEQKNSLSPSKATKTEADVVKKIVEELTAKLLESQSGNSRQRLLQSRNSGNDPLDLSSAFQYITAPATHAGAWNQPFVKGVKRIRAEAEEMLKAKAAPVHVKRLASMVASAASILAIGKLPRRSSCALRAALPIGFLGSIDFFRRGATNWEHDAALIFCYQYEQYVDIVLLGASVIDPPSRVPGDISSVNIFLQSPYEEEKVKKEKASDSKSQRRGKPATRREPFAADAEIDRNVNDKTNKNVNDKTNTSELIPAKSNKQDVDDEPKEAPSAAEQQDDATPESRGGGTAQCVEALLEILTGHLTPQTAQATEELVHQIHSENVDRVCEVLLLIKLTVAVVGNSADAFEALDIVTKVEKIFRSSDAAAERLAELVRLTCKVLHEPFPPAVDALLSLSHGDFAAIGMLLPPGTLSQAQLSALSYLMTTVSHAANGGGIAATVSGVEKQLVEDAKERVYDTLFHLFDPQNVGYITFDRFNSLIKRLNIVVSGVDAGAIFTKVDCDHSGKMERSEFKEAMELITQHLIQAVLTEVHLHPSQILAEMIAIGLFLILFSVFILFGMIAFTDGSVFTSCVAGSMPGASKALHAIASGAKGLTARAEKILDTII